MVVILAGFGMVLGYSFEPSECWTEHCPSREGASQAGKCPYGNLMIVANLAHRAGFLWLGSLLLTLWGQRQGEKQLL
jgi:hypothetical protein